MSNEPSPQMDACRARLSVPAQTVTIQLRLPHDKQEVTEQREHSPIPAQPKDRREAADIPCGCDRREQPDHESNGGDSFLSTTLL